MTSTYNIWQKDANRRQAITEMSIDIPDWKWVILPLIAATAGKRGGGGKRARTAALV
jgi:hypothetical protein